MSINKKIIKFTIILASILLLLTGLICILKCFYGEYPFYDFLLTIFGGAFASMLVVLACEIQKYLLNKKRIEDELFNTMTIAYANALVMKNIVDEIIKHPEKQVIENSLTHCQQQVLCALSNIYYCDYITFSKKHDLFCVIQDFRKNFDAIERKINNSRYLDIAINEDKIKELEKHKYSPIEITGNSPTVAKVAKKLSKEFWDVIEQIENFAQVIDYSSRYKWSDRKLSFQAQSNIFAQDHSIEYFLQEN